MQQLGRESSLDLMVPAPIVQEAGLVGEGAVAFLIVSPFSAFVSGNQARVVVETLGVPMRPENL